MNKQAIVIGLGQFGMAVAQVLSERGMEVLAVDLVESRVRAAAEFTAEAACFDAMDTDALMRTSPERREVCICAIGDESREASIICTALLRQMGAPRVIAALLSITKRALSIARSQRKLPFETASEKALLREIAAALGCSTGRVINVISDVVENLHLPTA